MKYNELLFNTKIKWAINPWNAPLMYVAKSKKPFWKGYVLNYFKVYDILEKGKLGKQSKDQWLPEVLGALGMYREFSGR